MRAKNASPRRLAAWGMAMALLALPAVSMAGEMEHGGMHGSHGTSAAKEGHMKMGDKIYAGKLGAWQAEARLIDMKGQMEKAKASGVKMDAAAMKSHHIAVSLTDQATKAAVADGKGTVTVSGPDKKEVKTGLITMAGHFGADVDLPGPGIYTFTVSIESSGKSGKATFRHTLK